MRESKAHAPGKLYIAGEYAVVTPGNPAILVAVDRFITAHIIPLDTPYGLITSTLLSNQPIEWSRDKNTIILKTENRKANILRSTMAVVDLFLKDHSIQLPYYHLRIKSELNDDKGSKYGLGSSGAVTIAVIRAVLQSVCFTVTDEVVYKLAALAHLRLGSNGSFGDLAAAAFTGWIRYASFDKIWVKNKLVKLSVNEVVNLSWPLLSIRPIIPSMSIDLLIGWTGEPASTESLVETVKQEKAEEEYHTFLIQSEKNVEKLSIAITDNNFSDMSKSIESLRKILFKMSKRKNIVIETPSLEKLCSIAVKHGAAAKSSGAGGGDCGIAFVNNKKHIPLILEEWKNNAIVPLPLSVYNKDNGVSL